MRWATHLLEIEFVIARPWIVVVDQVDTPQEWEVAKELVGGMSSTLLATLFKKNSCFIALALEGKPEKGAGSPKNSCQAFGTHCAQGTLERVIQSAARVPTLK
jgi:hypothetical protein